MRWAANAAGDGHETGTGHLAAAGTGHSFGTGNRHGTEFVYMTMVGDRPVQGVDMRLRLGIWQQLGLGIGLRPSFQHKTGVGYAPEGEDRPEAGLEASDDHGTPIGCV